MKYSLPFSQGKWHVFIRIMMENWEKNVKSRFWKSKSKENTDFDLEKWNLDKNPGQNSSETSQKWSILSGNHLGKTNFFIQKKIFFGSKNFFWSTLFT